MHQFSKALQRYRAVALVAVLFFVISATAQADAGKSLPNIKNFGQISEVYYRGGQPEGQDYADLATFGIKTVINLTSDDAVANEKAMVENAGMKYVQIPMTTRQKPTVAQLADFLGIVEDPVNQPVYVHCVGGKHRTGVMTAVYRMTKGWTAEQAFKEMKQYKFGADFLHSEFKKFVFEYYDQVVHTRTVPAPTEPVETAVVAKTSGS